MNKWYRKTGVKAIVLIVAILSGAMLITNLLSLINLAGSTDLPSLWTMSQQPFEESQEFNYMVENYMDDVLTQIRLENLYIEKNTHSVKAFGNPVRLTHLEFEILYLLASHPGKVFSTDEIFETVWKEKSFDMSNTVMVHIRRLREKLEGRQRKAQIIKTVWGVGYKIEA